MFKEVGPQDGRGSKKELGCVESPEENMERDPSGQLNSLMELLPWTWTW